MAEQAIGEIYIYMPSYSALVLSLFKFKCFTNFFPTESFPGVLMQKQKQFSHRTAIILFGQHIADITNIHYIYNDN